MQLTGLVGVINVMIVRWQDGDIPSAPSRSRIPSWQRIIMRYPGESGYNTEFLPNSYDKHSLAELGDTVPYGIQQRVSRFIPESVCSQSNFFCHISTDKLSYLSYIFHHKGDRL